MIRITFTGNGKGAWSFEITTNFKWVSTLRKHGIPAVGRIALSGVETGWLHADLHPDKTVFTYRTDEERTANAPNNFKRTHNGDAYVVEMSGRHLEQEEEL